MPPSPTAPSVRSFPPTGVMNRLIGSLSVFTMLMTIPQVLAIWVSRRAAGVSVLSWSAYLVSALLWFWYGLQKRDRNVYLPCIGWILLDGGVIAGVLFYR